MRAASLFSGCLGLDLGLEAVGIDAACYVENDKDCLRLIRARRPGVLIVEDVHELAAGIADVDLVAGGFPCQDMSYAGRGGGFDGDRSILWFEMARIVRELEPRLVLVENVPGLLTRGLVVVLHDLARAGYVGRWFALSAASLGAPHLRERIFVVARRAADAAPERLDGGHPVGLFDEDGWMPMQESLLEREPLARLGKRGRWTLRAVYEEDARLALADDSEETLLPTPSACESTPTPEFVDEIREAGMESDARLYLPGRRWHVQRTLSRIAPLLEEVDGPLLPTPVVSDGRGLTDGDSREGGASLREVEALLPTPGAWLGRRPENAMADPERAASREHDGLRGKRSVELPDAIAAEVDVDRLLPTPAARDAKGPNPNERDGGLDLPEAVRLMPTPTAKDADSSSGRDPAWGHGLTLTDVARGEREDKRTLLPTPVANPDNPGVDTLGRPNKGRPSRLLPTPTAEDGERGRNADDARDGGATLDGSVRLLPTPQAADGDGGRQEKGAMRHGGKRPSGAKGTLTLVSLRRPSPCVRAARSSPPAPGTAVDLADELDEKPFAAASDQLLLPTPETVNRKSRRALTSSGAGDGNGKRSGGGMSSPPGLEQVAEVVAGEYPDDFPAYDDLPPATKEIVDAAGASPWGVYEAAVARWEAILGRPAPAPTDEKGRLDPSFVEWMMSLPEGWTDIEGISRTARLRMLGNSVVSMVGAQVGLQLLALDRELSSEDRA